MHVLTKLTVIKVVPERGIKLIQEYNNILTKDEKQKHFLLHVVNYFRTKYPNSQKQSLIKK